MSTPTNSSPSKAQRNVLILAISGALGGFLFGFDSSVVNGAVDSIQGNFGLSNAVTGFAVGSALLGCALGAWLAGPMSNKWGRTRAMVIGSIFFLASSIGAGLAFSVWDLVLWRVIGGLGIGIASVTAPAYIAEVAPPDKRGALGSLQQLAITFGIFVALLSDTVLALWADGAANVLWFGVEAWRWMFIIGVIPSVVYGVVSWIIPESPRYLVLKNRTDEARSTISSLVPPGQVDRQLEDIRLGIEEDKRANAGTVRGKALGLKPIVWIGIGLAVLQQFVGINVIFYYSTTLWSSVGFDESNSLLISVITAVTNMVVTFIAIFSVDKLGRRPLLIGGGIGMTVSLAAMSVAFTQAVDVGGSPSLPGAWGPVALVAANVFVISFGGTWGPLMWLLLSEIFPSSFRAKAMGVATAANWLSNFAVTMLFPVISGVSLVLAYGLFAFFALLTIPFTYLFIPETKGVALEETGNLALPGLKRKQRIHRLDR